MPGILPSTSRKGVQFAFALASVSAWIVVCWICLAHISDRVQDITVTVITTLWLIGCGLAIWRQVESRKLLGQVLDTSPTGVVMRSTLRDENGAIIGLPITYMNRWASEIVGGRNGFLPEGGLTEVFEGELSEGAFGQYCHVIESGRFAEFEKRFIHHGKVRWVAVRAAKFGDGIVVNMVEITKRKATEEHLRLDEELLELTGRMTKSGGWEVLYPEGRIRWTPELYEIHEVGPDFELTSSSVITFFPPTALARMRAAYDDCVKEGVPFDIEVEFLTARNHRRWVRVSGRAEFSAGVLRRTYGAIQDITDQRQAREERQKNLLRLEKIASTLPCAVYQYQVCPDGRHGFTYISDRIADIYGCSPVQLIADSDRAYAIIHPDDIERVRTNDGMLHAEASEWRQEFRICRDGEIRWILDQSVPETMPDGSSMWFGFLMDVTWQKQIEKELMEAKDAAEAASHAKSDFLAVMSHEIRTPMNGVLGFAELLAQGELNPEQQEHVRTIRQSGETMLRIINDILDYSRIEAGRLEIEARGFGPEQVIEDVRSILEPSAVEKSITLEVHVSGRIPERVIGDEARLRQVLMNLAGNAVKFTTAGGVVLEIEEVREGMLRFSVRDTGPGIPPDKLENIFDPFVQADSSIARRFGGTGLGLAIARRLVDLMGGCLEVQSRLGVGSEFSFEIPLPRDAPAPGRRVAHLHFDEEFSVQHPVSILVAEDDEVNRLLIRTVLRRLGYEPVMARDGEEAVGKYCSTRPQCVLMDLHMPVIDGIEATRRIREIEALDAGRPRAFISALTADVLPAERECCERAGMDAYLSKPLDIDALGRVLEQASRRFLSGAPAHPQISHISEA
jgi:PAS domain S-box-containing protein